MHLQSSHVLKFALRIHSMLESCLVTASSQMVNPFLQPPVADVLNGMGPFIKQEEQFSPFDGAVFFTKFGMMT